MTVASITRLLTNFRQCSISVCITPKTTENYLVIYLRWPRSATFPTNNNYFLQTTTFFLQIPTIFYILATFFYNIATFFYKLQLFSTNPNYFLQITTFFYKSQLFSTILQLFPIILQLFSTEGISESFLSVISLVYHHTSREDGKCKLSK